MISKRQERGRKAQGRDTLRRKEEGERRGDVDVQKQPRQN